MAELVAACVVHKLRPDAGLVGVFAIEKRPVSGSVRVRGLHAAVQVSRNRRGGELQALYVDAKEDADYWEDELRRPLDAGWFGENLRVSGLWSRVSGRDVSGARVGER